MNLEQEMLIERFLKNELSEEEKKVFLKNIKEDSDFREQVLLEKKLIEVFNQENWSFIEKIDNTELFEYEKLYKSNFTNEIKQSIKKANKDYQKKRSSVRKLLYYAAAIVVVFLTTVIFLDNFSKQDEFFEVYLSETELPSFANRGNSAEEKLIQAEMLFNQKEYIKALPIFLEHLEVEKNNSSLYLYVAICYIKLEQYTNAEKVLNQLINSDLIDASKAHWFKSLLYLKSKDKGLAKKELEVIINNSYYNKEQAEKLLKELN